MTWEFGVLNLCRFRVLRKARVETQPNSYSTALCLNYLYFLYFQLSHTSFYVESSRIQIFCEEGIRITQSTAPIAPFESPSAAKLMSASHSAVGLLTKDFRKLTAQQST